MDCTMIDMARYPRKAHFDYFRAMAYPYVGVTVKVDITQFLEHIRALGAPFFLSFVYCVTRAANTVPELRQRIDGDGIREYAWCPGSVTLALPDGTYCYCTLDCREDFAGYLPAAETARAKALAIASVEDGEDGDSLLFLSSLPWLHYEAFTQPVPTPADSNPRITWGRFAATGEKTLIPVTLLCNHALVDGRHLAAFFEALDRELSFFTLTP